jgi:hypothetical protein
MPAAGTAGRETSNAVNAFQDSVLALNDLRGFEFDEAYEISEETSGGSGKS